MKENDFLNCVSNIEADVVDRFLTVNNKLSAKINRAKKWRLRMGAVAACLALIVCTIAILAALKNSVSPTPPIQEPGSSGNENVNPN